MTRANSRKGQVTVFIILGIVVLLIAALGFYAWSQLYLQKPVVPEITVSDELKPLQSYVSQCLAQVSKEGLQVMGRSGGYAVPESLRANPIPYKGEAILFEPDRIAYWYYVDSCSLDARGCVLSKRPPLCQPGKYCVIEGSNGPGSIQAQLNSYIASHMADCTGDFSQFSSQFEVSPGVPSADAVIGEKDITVVLRYPVAVKSLSTRKEEMMHTFPTVLDVPLKHMYAFASEITKTQQESHFMENIALNLIAVYSAIRLSA